MTVKPWSQARLEARALELQDEPHPLTETIIRDIARTRLTDGDLIGQLTVVAVKLAGDSDYRDVAIRMPGPWMELRTEVRRTLIEEQVREQLGLGG